MPFRGILRTLMHHRIGVVLGSLLLIAGAWADALVVRVLAGSALFEESAWVRQNLPKGAAGWMVGSPESLYWQEPDWTLRDVAYTGAVAGGAPLPLVRDRRFAYGVRAEIPKPFPFREGMGVIELGEVARAEAYARWCTPEQADALKRLAWRHIDTLLETLARQAQARKATLWVLGIASEREPSPSLHAVFVLGIGKGVLYDPAVREPMLVGGRPANEWQVLPQAVEVQSLIAAPVRWRAKQSLQDGGKPLLFGIWSLGLLGWAGGAIRPRKASKRILLRVIQPASPSVSARPPLLVLAMAALGVASLLPAAIPVPTLFTGALAVVIGVVLLTSLGRVLDTREVALGAIAGLGILALGLDMQTGGVWNRDGLLGYGVLNPQPPQGLSEAHGGLMLGWAVLLTLAWLRIEGNPLALVYGLGALCLWMGWRGGDWMLTGATALFGGWLGFSLLRHEMRSRKQIRIAIQNRPVRVVAVPPERRLLWAIGIFGAMVLGGVILGARAGFAGANTTPSLAGAVLLGACLLSGWSLWRTHRWHTLPLPLLQAGLAASAFSLLWLRVETAALLLFHLALPILAGEPPPPSKPFQQEDKP